MPLYLHSRDYFISPNNTVTVEKRDNQDSFALHRHDFAELVIVSAGSGLHIWNDIPYPITCGDILYINADDKHGYASVNNLRLDNILYHRDKLTMSTAIEPYLPARTANELERFWRINPSCLKQVIPLIEQLQIETKKPDPISIHLVEAIFLQLVIVLYRFRGQRGSTDLAPTYQLDILLTALHNSVAIPFNLAAFCEQHGISSRSLRRLFKTQTGMTISGYLQQLRLCRAMTLLRNVCYSISHIAAECGYEDSNYFSSVFRKATDLTPTEYRARFTENN